MREVEPTGDRRYHLRSVSVLHHGRLGATLRSPHPLFILSWGVGTLLTEPGVWSSIFGTLLWTGIGQAQLGVLAVIAGIAGYFARYHAHHHPNYWTAWMLVCPLFIAWESYQQAVTGQTVLSLCGVAIMLGFIFSAADESKWAVSRRAARKLTAVASSCHVRNSR